MSRCWKSCRKSQVKSHKLKGYFLADKNLFSFSGAAPFYFPDMWIDLNIFLKSYFRPLHSFLKKFLATWMKSQTGFPPVLKCIGGSLFWVHPRFLTERTHDIQPLVFQWITRLLRPGDIFFDVGAHCGCGCPLRLDGLEGRALRGGQRKSRGV
jgi:hypothetical protein